MTRPPGPVAYVLHGYRLETDVPLPGYRQANCLAGYAPADRMRLRHAPPRLPDCSDAAGEVLADLSDPERRQVYRFTRSGGELLLRFTGAADIITDGRLRCGVARTWPGADPGVLSVLLPGAVIATRLMLDGRLVLHASAFESAGRAVAFVGSSGMGKSTLAALAVLAGHRQVSDDVLRVDLEPAGPRVWPGATEARLRASARDVVPLFGAAGSARTTADGRIAVADRDAAADGDATRTLPLGWCVVPHPRRDVTRVCVRRLRAFEALRWLSAFPRVVGWRHQATAAQQFQMLADLCERVPVLEAAIPWGPPFDPGVVHDLVAALPAS